MKRQDLNAVKNFDFLARSFARMYAMGQPVDIDAVTGNMTEQKQWFRNITTIIANRRGAPE
jgi:hypothetical protein